MKKICIICLLICLSAILHAQVPEKKVILHTQSGEINNTYHADMNNDGIFDFITSNATTMFWYAVDAASNWTNKYLIETDVVVSDMESVEMRDMNADGYTDIFYRSGDFPYDLYWIENPHATDESWPVHMIDVSVGAWIGFIDTDGDGDADMVYEDPGSYLCWTENIDGVFEIKHMIEDLLPSVRYSTIADFDQDGDLDWAGFFYDCCVAYFQNNSDGTFSYEYINSDEYQYGLISADANNDGYPDLFIEIGANEYIATFNPVSNEFGPQAYYGNYDDFNTIKITDIDHDGDNDWIFLENTAGAEFASLKMIENTGGEMLLDDLQTLQDSLSKNEYYFAFYNYDNDELPDLFMDDNNFLSVYPNAFPESGFSAPIRLDSTYVKIDVMLPFDADGDSDEDIFVASHDGVLAWMKYDAASDSIYAVHHIQNIEASPYPSCLQNFDVDSDGDQDLIASFHSYYGAGGISYYLLNDGAGNFYLHEFTEFAFKKIWMTDADDDGDADLIGWRFESNKLELFLNTGDTSALFSDDSDITPTGLWKNFEISDADNDGDEDFIGTQEGVAAIYMIANTNGAETFSAAYVLKGTICTVMNAIYSDDFDGDADDDIFYSCSYSGNAYKLTNAGGFFTSSSAGYFSDQDLSAPGFMYSKDLNLDNSPDLILSNGMNTTGTAVKLAEGAGGTFQFDFNNASADFGFYTFLDENDMIDFIGTNELEFYVQYDVITKAPEYIVIPPTKTYLEEDASGDSIGIYFTEIPQTALSVRFHPGPVLDAGAGAGEEIVYVINPDSTALLPHYFYYQVPEDALVEDYSTEIISLTDEAGWGLYAGTLHAEYAFIVTDNDPGLFYTDVPAINEGASQTVSVHLNAIPDAPLTLHLQPETELNASAGFGVPVEFELPPSIEAIENIIINLTAENDYIHEETHISQLPVSFFCDDSLFNSMLTDTIQISLTDNDNASFSTLIPGSYYTEGLEDFSITIHVTSAPQADVQIIADPDSEIDLGAGPGVAVTMDFIAGDIIPDAIVFSGIPSENLIVDGLHFGHIEFSVITDDPYYEVLNIPEITISILDNDLSAVQHSELTAAYLEGLGEFAINFNLSSIPSEDVSVIAVPDMNLDLGAGFGVAVEFTFIAEGELPDDISISGIPFDNMLNDGLHSGFINYITSSDDPVFDGVAIANSEIFIEDNDDDGMALVCAADLIYPEGTIEIPADIYLFTQPADNVFIYAVPDAQIDLGEGPGMPLVIIANVSYEPGDPLIFEISIVDDLLSEGFHDGQINFIISTDDPFYAGYALEPLIIHIDDNDAATALINADQNQFLIYPAMSNGIFTITYDGSNDGIISIFDATGRWIKEIEMNSSGKTNIDISEAAAGMYYVRLQKGNVFSTKIIELIK